MITPLTEQIRAYFDDADRQQGAVDIAAVRRAVEEERIVLELSPSDARLPRVPTRRRWPTIVVAAAVVLIVVGALVLVPRDDKDEPQVPAVTPPVTGDLIVSLWSHPLAGGDNVHVKVYADGRVLRSSHANWIDPAVGASRWLEVSGWQERRLSAEGVELLLSEVSSSGLFDPDQPVPDAGEYPNPTSVPQSLRGTIQVVNGDTSVELDCCWGPNLDRLQEFSRLLKRLREPETWLPPNAWTDPESTPYRASWSEVCLSYEDLAEQPIEPSQVISVLPPPAQDPLNGATTRTEVTLRAKYTDTTVQTRSIVHCLDVDDADSHRFTEALDVAGIEHLDDQSVYRHNTDIVGGVDIFIQPYLPHGKADCGCSG